MAADLIEVPVRLLAFGAEAAPARAAVALNPPGLRARRALAALGACWGLAVAAVFIPVAHFVLVPALLVAGPVLAIRRLGEHRSLVRLEGRCARCGLEQAFDAAGRFPPKRPVVCHRCRAELRVEADA
ncbi:MAG TPA: hypothetical protein VIM86_14970 [Thermodesulfobacteriota bacterium]